MRRLFVFIGLAQLACCSKTETVPFEIVFEPEAGATYIVEVFETADCTSTERPGGLPLSTFDYPGGSLPTSIPLSRDQAGVRIYLTNTDTCETLAACTEWSEGDSAVRLVVDAAPAFVCTEMCCEGICATSCDLADAGRRDAGNDGGNDGGSDAGGDAAGDAPPMDAGDDAPPIVECGPPVQISTGAENSCVVTELGCLYCWGDNGFRQSAPATNDDVVVPTRIGADLGAFVQVEAGDEHVCGRIDEQRVYCWGNNFGDATSDQHNRLGRTTTDDDAQNGPFEIMEETSSIFELAVGLWHTCALRGDPEAKVPIGDVYCWGQNASAELGRLDTGMPLRENNQLPASIEGGTLPAFTNVVAGVGNSCAWNASALYCWGYDGQNAVGTAGTSNAVRVTEVTVPSPVTVMASSHAQDVDLLCGSNAFGGNTCAIIGNELYCWGANGCGGCGNGTTETIDQPQRVGDALNVAGASNWILAVGRGTSCAARQSPGTEGRRELYCWGSGANGKLQGVVNQTTASTAAPLASDVIDVDVGRDHVCVINGDSTIDCWGSNARGQVAPSEAQIDYSEPQQVTLPTSE